MCIAAAACKETASVGATLTSADLQSAARETMTGEQTADKIHVERELKPNATCGFVQVTFISNEPIAAGDRPAPFAAEPP